MSINLDSRSGWKVSTLILAWGVLMYGVLFIQFLPLDASHSICGPWGCGPPLPPLLASHGFWLVLLSLPTAVVCSILQPLHLRRLGFVLLAAGLSGFVLVGVWDMVSSLPHWLPRMRNLEPRYYVQRYLLSLATLIDAPIVQVTLGGVVCVFTARVRMRRGERGQISEVSDQEREVAADRGESRPQDANAT